MFFGYHVSMDNSTAPANRLDARVRTAWRVQNMVGGIPLFLVAAVASSAMAVGERGLLLSAVPIVAALVLITVWVILIPAVRYRRWRWEVTADEVRLQRGIIIIERTVIPMVRVQHVDTTQGPILSAFRLSEVRVWTAAGMHAIPALADTDAAELRDHIAKLARVTDDGGV
jgi:uncharacterized protein